jgi:hypothetical protein
MVGAKETVYLASVEQSLDPCQTVFNRLFLPCVSAGVHAVGKHPLAQRRDRPIGPMTRICMQVRGVHSIAPCSWYAQPVHVAVRLAPLVSHGFLGLRMRFRLAATSMVLYSRRR